jgi:hypothetical protein
MNCCYITLRKHRNNIRNFTYEYEAHSLIRRGHQAKVWTERWYGSGGHAEANRHALLNTRKLPVYSTSRLCQQTQTLSLLVVVQGQ